MAHFRVTRDTPSQKWPPTLTKQSFRDECDVNVIMKKYEKSGLLLHTTRYQGRYEDVSNSLDLQTSLAVVEDAEEMFGSLPSAVRRKFDNNPISFLAWVQDPANLDEVQKMGLGAPEEVPTPVTVLGAVSMAPDTPSEPRATT